MPTSYYADGFYLEREPISEFDYRDRTQLIEALRNNIARGNPVIQATDPQSEQRKTPDIQKRIGAGPLDGWRYDKAK